MKEFRLRSCFASESGSHQLRLHGMREPLPASFIPCPAINASIRATRTSSFATVSFTARKRPQNSSMSARG